MCIQVAILQRLQQLMSAAAQQVSTIEARGGDGRVVVTATDESSSTPSSSIKADVFVPAPALAVAVPAAAAAMVPAAAAVAVPRWRLLMVSAGTDVVRRPARVALVPRPAAVHAVAA